MIDPAGIGCDIDDLYFEIELNNRNKVSLLKINWSVFVVDILITDKLLILNEYWIININNYFRCFRKSQREK